MPRREAAAQLAGGEGPRRLVHLPTATCAIALVERVVHHADIVKIEGESYRLREFQADATSRSESRHDKKQPAEA